MGRQLTIALAASLAANVFLGGFVLGRMVGADGGAASPTTDAPDARSADVEGDPAPATAPFRTEPGDDAGKPPPRRPRGGPGGRRSPPTGPFENIGALSPEGRATFRQVFLSNRDALRSHRMRRAERIDDLGALLAADDFDAERVRAALDALAEAERAHRALQNAALVKAMAELSPEDRKRLAQAQRRRRGRAGRLRDPSSPPAQ
ncbi:MAG: periplasmic heavy metal sensor [Pseudomonadota bacterium]